MLLRQCLSNAKDISYQGESAVIMNRRMISITENVAKYFEICCKLDLFQESSYNFISSYEGYVMVAFL